MRNSSLPYFECKTGSGEILKILVDTGSNKNYIRPYLVDKPIRNEESFFANSVGGKLEITHHTYINLFNDERKLKFFLLPPLHSFHAILGNDSLKDFNTIIYTKESFMLINKTKKVILKQLQSQYVNIIKIRDDHMSSEQQKLIQEVIEENTELFSEPNEKLTYTTKVVAEIRTNTDRPVYTKFFPYPLSIKDEVEKQVNELLENGIIRPSRSPYNSPVWIVEKKADASANKKFRMVIDYRKINSVTIADRYPIPDINEVLAQLGENKIFSVVDLKSGFHQIPLRECDIEKTAFSVKNGKYEFLRLPFGLKNAPSIFQRALDDILREHIGKICYVYIDDIIIFSKNESSHANHINLIFKTLKAANMKVQLDKSEFFKKQVEFLGFVITDKGITTNSKKVEAINNFPQPRTLKDLRSFLGLSGYYRRFIKDYAKIAKPLTNLLRGEEGRVSKNVSKNRIIKFGGEEMEAFDKIKRSLTSSEVVLKYPDFAKEFSLTTDASNYAIGAVLEQGGKPITFIFFTF